MAHENILKMRKELVKFRYIEKRAKFGQNFKYKGIYCKKHVCGQCWIDLGVLAL